MAFSLLRKEFVLTETALGFKMLVDPNSLLGRQIRATGIWEEPTTRLIQRRLRRSQTFVDVGANVGYYSILASMIVGEQGRVVSFEPSPDTFRVLAENLALNGIQNVRAEPLAISDRTGGDELRRNPFDAINDSLLSRDSTIRVRVRTTTMDSYFGSGTIDFVKIDAEGSELKILNGMRRVLQKMIQMVMEYNPPLLKQIGIHPSYLLSKLKESGLEVYSIEENGDIKEFRESAKNINIYCANF